MSEQTNYIVNGNGMEQSRRWRRSLTIRLLPPVSVTNRAEPGDLYEVDKSYPDAPYMIQTAIGVDRTLPARTQLSINFVDTRGLTRPAQRDINAPTRTGTSPDRRHDVPPTRA